MELQNKLYWYKALCERVVDGDTINFLFFVGMNVCVKERVRLYGIDTPEIYGVKKESEEYALGYKSSARVKELIDGKTVWVNTKKDKKGKYGRYLALVYFEDENGELQSLTELLVKEGLAEVRDY